MTHPRVALLAAALLLGPGTVAYAQMIVGPAAGPGPGPRQAPPPGSSGMIVGPAAGPTAGPMTGPMGAPMGGPGMGPGPSAGMPPCMQQFMPLRAEAEKRAGVLSAGISKKKKQPAEVCQLFRSFSEAEAKVVNFAVSNQAGCHIPPDAVASMKKNHAKTNEVRDKVCALAERPAQPAGPNLGEALGLGSLPTAETTRSGTGTLDSLSGNPLAR